jgi:hypothetical protein
MQTTTTRRERTLRSANRKVTEAWHQVLILSQREGDESGAFSEILAALERAERLLQEQR